MRYIFCGYFVNAKDADGTTTMTPTRVVTETSHAPHEIMTEAPDRGTGSETFRKTDHKQGTQCGSLLWGHFGWLRSHTLIISVYFPGVGPDPP